MVIKLCDYIFILKIISPLFYFLSCDDVGNSSNFTREVFGRTSCARPGQYDGLRYCGDKVQAVGRSIDKCGGYAGRDGVYKYLMTPTCLQQQLRYVRFID